MSTTKYEDVQWLRELHAALWPENHKNVIVSLVASRELTKSELSRVLAILEARDLIVEMICTNMFGGYGIKIYDGPHYPGLPPRLLLTLIEDHLPSPTFWDHIAGEAKTPNKTPGGGRTDAWELFTQYTHTERNQELLKMFDLEPSRERSHYDY